MSEVFPVLSGLVLGVLWRRRALSSPLLAAATLVLGIGAAFASGELRVSWAFAMVDIALVAAGAVASVVSSRWAVRFLAPVSARYSAPFNATARKAQSAG